MLFPPPAVGQSESVSLSGRTAQYVFIVDDSGSMAGGGGPAADPDRLAVFAVRSIVHMLEDTDEATVVRLNGPREGDQPPPVAPLGREHRQQLLRRLDTDSKLAHYGGQYTPCRTALEKTKELLAAAYRDGVPQIVMFLTDGECTPRNQRPVEVPDPQAFLRGLESHRDGLFRFYLLRFRGRQYSGELRDLARATGGQILEVGAEDPTKLVEPFADALTRSQGYEAEVLTPSSAGLPSYAGARRVRLLAVARGEGPKLEFEVSSAGGRGPRLRDMGSGRHRYGRGQIYRFSAVSYRPGAEPVEVRVQGAGSGWKVVAVPEYRLAVELELLQGECDRPGSALRHGTETGSTVCARVSLVDETGRPVPRDLTGGRVKANVRFGRVEREGQKLPLLPAEPLGGRARFGLQRQSLEPGDYIFQAYVALRLGGQEHETRLAGSRRLLQVTSVNVRPEPAVLELAEDLRPGGLIAVPDLRFTGNFPPTPARLEVVDRDRLLPSCVTVTLGDRAEGESFEVTVGQPYTVGVRMAPYCGPQVLDRQVDTLLRLVFDPAAGGPALSAVDVPLTFHLSYRLEVPPEVTLRVPAGETATARVKLGGNHVRPAELVAVLEPEDERPGWPGGDLELGFADPEGGLRAGEEHRLTLDPRTGGPLVLGARADTCCPGGDYTAELGFLPAGGEVYAGGQKPRPLVLPVRVEVEGSGAWACWGPRVYTAVGLLLLLLLLLYLMSMFRHTRLLSHDRLAEQLNPLRWDEYGEPVAHSNSSTQQEVRSMVKRGLRWPGRILAWLKANPLVFGLPGRSYRETVELSLQPETRPQASRIRLMPEREHYQRLQRRPADGRNQLFAAAQGGGGVFFYGVPNHGRLGRLTVERLADSAGWAWEEDEDAGTGGDELKVEELREGETLVYETGQERQEGQAAGWQIG